MGYARRVLLVSAVVALPNLAVMLVVSSDAERWSDPRYWDGYGAVSFFAVLTCVYLITAFGLSLLVLLSSPILSRITNRIIAFPLFVILGALLGWGMFIWTPIPLFFGACGAITSAACALLAPNLIASPSAALVQGTLAERG